MSLSKLSKEYVHRVSSVLGKVKSDSSVISYMKGLHKEFFTSNQGLKAYFSRVNRSVKTDDNWVA